MRDGGGIRRLRKKSVALWLFYLLTDDLDDSFFSWFPFVGAYLRSFSAHLLNGNDESFDYGGDSGTRVCSSYGNVCLIYIVLHCNHSEPQNIRGFPKKCGNNF